MMKYVVELGYRTFVFDNAAEAVNFAEIAQKHYMEEDDRVLDVVIRFIVEKED